MIFKKRKDIYKFLPFEKYSWLVHGFTNSKLGDIDLEDEESRGLSLFANRLGVDKSKMVGMRQVHGSKVQEVLVDNSGLVDSCDGIYCACRGVFLVVRTADCVPILIFDEKTKMVGVVHAGWKGTLSEIAKNMIEVFIRKGSSGRDIIIGLGPSICADCYKVDEKRARLFDHKFGFGVENEKLNLPALNTKQLMDVGIKQENIYKAEVCTYEADDFFSYRAGDRGEFIGVIGVK